ncbi:putative glycosyl transferase [Cylindrospermum sp. NIES-4074]|nr:putative glycosyl transferase [Cylindrospermum sp. NIES-4074]
MISIVMAAYNASEYIALAIESILNQTFSEFELIVIDDGSTDNTVKIVEHYIELDQRVRLIQNNHTGVCHARNTGIQSSKYSWIAIMDADDISLPQRLEKQINAAKANPEVVAWGTYVQHMSSTGDILSLQKQGPISQEEYHSLMNDGEIPFIIHPTTMMKKDVFLKVGAYDSQFPLAQDLELMSRMAHQGIIIAIPEPLVWYRVHSQSASMQKFFSQQFFTRWIIARHQARLAGTGLPELNQFIAEEKKQSILLRLAQQIGIVGRFNYRMAGLLLANKQYLQGGFYLCMAIVFHPSYSLPRLWKQRFSQEARRYLQQSQNPGEIR